MRDRKIDFLNKCFDKHGKKYDYSLVDYKNNNTKVTILCQHHGEFSQTPKRHIKSIACCPRCANTVIDTKSFIEDSVKIHNNAYDYSFVDYVNNTTYVQIICIKHAIAFIQNPTLHRMGKTRCPECRAETLTRWTWTQEKLIEASKEKFGENTLDYSNFKFLEKDKNGIRKIAIACKIHGEFTVTITKHLSSRGCPKCTPRVSLFQTKFLDAINIPSQYREYKIPITKQNFRKPYIVVDGYDPETNTVYQCHGILWHAHPKFFPPEKMHSVRKNIKNKDIYEKTLKVDQEIRNHGYNLFVIWEHELDNFILSITLYLMFCYKYL